MPEFLLPFGPFHMVMLHLPIGALTALWFLEILLENKGDKHKSQAIGLLHLFLLLTCGLTIALGLSYEEFGQYGDEMDQHKLWGYIFGGCVLASYAFYWIHRTLGKRGSKLIYILSLLATTIAMVITGHQGGELIHGKGFLAKPFKTENRRTVTAAPTQVIHKQPAQATPTTITTAAPMMNTMVVAAPPKALSSPPSSLKSPPSALSSPPSALPPPPSALKSQQVALFESSQTIFQRNCTKCHGATKQKGDYRLDSKHSIHLGGKSELAAIVPGNPDDSELMYRMRLPRHDDDAMPPEEKDPVSTEDIDTIRQWIEAGAYWPEESELNTTSHDTIEIGDARTDELITQMASTGVKAEYNAWGDQSVRVDLGVVDPGQLEKAIQQLNSFGNKLAWLDCSELELPQGFFKQLQQFTKLQRLHLDGSNVSDAQLQSLSQLPQLSYLNLYNTNISDAGLIALQSIPNLQKVFLSETQVTPKGVAQLKQSKPALDVIHQ